MVKSENLEKIFNLPSSSNIIEGEFIVESKDVVVTDDKSLMINKSTKLEDSDYIRENLRKLVENTKTALDLALEIQAENPTNFKNTEAVSKMADSVSKALSNLIHLNKTEKDEEFRAKDIDKLESPKTVNNNLILTTENMIKEIIKQTRQLKEI